MKKFLSTLCLGVGLLVGACTPDQTATLAQIQQAAVQACGFLPTAVTVASLFPTTGQYIGTASSIASAICATVTANVPKSARLVVSKKAALKGAAPSAVSVIVPIGGVPVTVSGYFVR